MKPIEAKREYQRISLMNYCGALKDLDLDYSLQQDEKGDWVLRVTVPGPTGSGALFSLTDVDQPVMSLTAFYASTIVKEGRSALWSVTAGDNALEIGTLIADFAMECFDLEFGRVLVPTMINDDNLKFFAPLLSDRILTEENIYALGVFLQDEGGLEVAAAAGFSISGDQLVIEDINVRSEYKELAIDRYLVRYIRDMIVKAEPHFDGRSN